MSSDKKDKEMICGLTADERDLLQLELNGLPDVDAAASRLAAHS